MYHTPSQTKIDIPLPRTPTNSKLLQHEVVANITAAANLAPSKLQWEHIQTQKMVGNGRGHPNYLMINLKALFQTLFVRTSKLLLKWNTCIRVARDQFGNMLPINLSN